MTLLDVIYSVNMAVLLISSTSVVVLLIMYLSDTSNEGKEMAFILLILCLFVSLASGSVYAIKEYRHVNKTLIETVRAGVSKGYMRIDTLDSKGQPVVNWLPRIIEASPTVITRINKEVNAQEDRD